MPMKGLTLSLIKPGGSTTGWQDMEKKNTLVLQACKWPISECGKFQISNDSVSFSSRHWNKCDVQWQGWKEGDVS